MNLNAINNNSLEALLDSVFQNSSSTAATSSIAFGSTSNSSTKTSDHGHLSPFAQLVSLLQELQQTNPAEYQTVAQQIAASLQSAAQTDQANGDTASATSGQLPNLQDLAQALDTNTADPKITVSLSQLEQLLASLQPTSTQNQSQTPLAIILNTLANAA
jgi:hypothetical protein